MPLLNWDSRYSVGVAAMDAQHERLAGLLNSLHEAVRSGVGEHALGDALEDLVLYAKSHFAAEERLMHEANFADLTGHRESHEAVVDKAATFLLLLRNGETTITANHLQFWREWLIAHVLQEDAQYGAALGGAALSLRAA